jgi:hypothetical protein
MIKPSLSSLVAVTMISTVATAAPSHRHKVRRANLAAMNLTPTKIAVPQIPTPYFAPDRTPTAFRYALPEPGMGAVIGYKPDGDIRPIPSYEVNQANAIGFSQPTSSVGAALAYRF